MRYHFCWDREPPKARAPLKQSEGFEARHQYQMAPLHNAVVKPNGDAKRKAAPKGGAVKPAGKAKGVAKGKALAGVAVWAGQMPTNVTSSHGSGSCVPSSPSRAQKLVKRYQHLRLCHRSPWDFRQVQLCLHFMVVYIQPGAALHLRWRRVRWRLCLFLCRLPTVMISVCFTDLPASMICSTWLSTPVNSLSVLCDQAGVPSATSISRLTWRQATPLVGSRKCNTWVAVILCLANILHSYCLPLVCYLCVSSISSLCCTWVSWPDRDVVHSDTLRRRSATALSETWVLPSVVASAVLRLAQDQGRAAQIDPQQRGPPGPEIPGDLGKVPSVAKAGTAPCGNAAPAPSVPLEASSLPNDPSVAGLLKKVAELKECMSTPLFLGGFLADKSRKTCWQ